MENFGLLGLILILINTIVSYYGLTDGKFSDKYDFSIEGILIRKQYLRLISSGFLHGSFFHLIFNMVALYYFSTLVENHLGELQFCLIYFGSLLGGNLLSLFIHRNHEDYRAAGASGAISGIIFSCIALFPDLKIGFLGIPGGVSTTVYALIFISVSMVGIKNQQGNIGHDAHLGGALTGILISLLISPQSLFTNYLPILIVIVPTSIFLFLVITKPAVLVIGGYKNHTNYDSKEIAFENRKTIHPQEIDRILDKINQMGYEKLTRKEKQILNEFAKQENEK